MTDYENIKVEAELKLMVEDDEEKEKERLRQEKDNAEKDNAESRRSVIQVTELQFESNWLTTDRNAPALISLPAK